VDADSTITAILEWIEDDDNVRLVVLTGSSARGVGQVDSLSDLDVELYVHDPSVLLDDRVWHHRFGDLLVREELSNAGWNPTRLLYYVDGKIDFTIVDVRHLPNVVHDRPFRVLLDRDSIAARLKVVPSAAQPPTAAEVEECVNWFYAAALMEAKQLVRAEPWPAMYREWDLLRQLLRMIAWEHKSRYGWDYDTWFNGRHFERWADTDIRARCEVCWSRNDLSSMQQGLIASIELFASLEPHVATAIGSDAFDHARSRAEVHRILALRTKS